MQLFWIYDLLPLFDVPTFVLTRRFFGLSLINNKNKTHIGDVCLHFFCKSVRYVNYLNIPKQTNLLQLSLVISFVKLKFSFLLASYVSWSVAYRAILGRERYKIELTCQIDNLCCQTHNFKLVIQFLKQISISMIRECWRTSCQSNRPVIIVLFSKSLHLSTASRAFHRGARWQSRSSSSLSPDNV